MLQQRLAMLQQTCCRPTGATFIIIFKFGVGYGGSHVVALEQERTSCCTSRAAGGSHGNDAEAAAAEQQSSRVAE